MTELTLEKHFDVIILTGSVNNLPPSLFNYLATNGKLFAVIGKKPIMKATLYTKLDQNKWSEQHIFETVIPELIDAPKTEEFVF